ncbi:MAG: signal peptidase I [Candidatus Gracilibacteria bacterium]|nr:signal peptidase I [Candidatus Gracilibacteria bacterium]
MIHLARKNTPLLLLILAIIVCSLYFALRGSGGEKKISSTSEISKKDCTVTQTTETVSGNSMMGLLENGQEITVLKGYYRCNEVKRNDTIIYPYAGNPIPIVKSVKALPGDRFGLKKDKTGLWNILVNDVILTTSNGTPYALSEPKSKMLALYADSYHGVIPADAYIILGNLPGGTMDSTQFGLVNRVDFIGKVQ